MYHYFIGSNALAIRLALTSDAEVIVFGQLAYYLAENVIMN